jgi:hypothetical protein
MITATKPKNRVSKSANGRDKATKGGGTSNQLELQIKRPDIRMMSVEIKGVTSLIVHAWSAKAMGMIEGKHQHRSSANAPREKRIPHQEYLDAFYMMPGSAAPETKIARYGIPASGFKRACEGVCKRKFVNMKGTVAAGAFSILEDAGGLVELKCSKPFMRTDMVRIGNFRDKPDFRYRPEFSTWSCELRIRYNAGVISLEQIVNILMHAGFHEGWGELRAGKGYDHGQWEIGVVKNF